MTTYFRIKAHDIIRYRRTMADSNKILFIKPDRVPAEVLQKMTEFDVDKVEYDDRPELPRCLFCEGYRSHQRVFQGAMVALCSVHYFNKTIGQIAQALRSKGSENGVFLEKSPIGKQKGKSQTAKS